MDTEVPTGNMDRDSPLTFSVIFRSQPRPSPSGLGRGPEGPD